MQECPCRGCEERMSTCHSTCKKYHDWVIIKDARNAAIRADKAKEDLLFMQRPRRRK